MNKWKITAIIFIVLFTLENAYLLDIYTEAGIEAEKELDCAYNFCTDYPTYYYSDGYCGCFEGDKIVEEKYFR